MTFKHRRRKTWIRMSVISMTAVVLSLGLSGTASASSPWTVQTTAFANWGDQNLYFTLAGGSVESKTWLLKSTRTASYSNENEPWHVNGTADKLSVSLAPTGSAVLPFSTVPYANDVRFFVKSPGPKGVLTIRISENWPGLCCRTYFLDYTVTGLAAGWGVTPAMPTPNYLWQGLLNVSVSVANSGSGIWNVDDVMMDPHRYT
jgi:hypothetical protein